MCSIVASFSRDKLIELCKLNEYRGQHSHSISYYDLRTSIITKVHRGLGPLNYDTLVVPDDTYLICHQQAPTTENRDLSAVHPAEYHKRLLWHNGILKPETIRLMQEDLNASDTWDSMLLLKHLMEYPVPLDTIDGSFSCLFWDQVSSKHGSLVAFRNEIAPLFVDNDLNISSTKFPSSSPIKPNIMFQVIPEKKQLIETSLVFTTADNPYYFQEELNAIGSDTR